MMRTDSFLGRVVAALARSTPAFRPAHAFPQLDAKSGLLTTRNWSSAAANQLARSSRAGLLMIDMDGFKTVNDTFGHRAGDVMLGSVGRLLQAESWPGSLIGRFGGDEFVVLLPDVGVEHSMVIAEHLRARIAELSVSAVSNAGEWVVLAARTASVGVAGKPRHGDNLEALIQAADSGLHLAKRSGGNVVRAADTGEKAPQDVT